MKEIAIAPLCNLTFITSTHASQPTTGGYISADVSYRDIDGGKVFRSESDGIDPPKAQVKVASNTTYEECCI